jgi:hypothetical protein
MRGSSPRGAALGAEDTPEPKRPARNSLRIADKVVQVSVIGVEELGAELRWFVRPS